MLDPFTLFPFAQQRGFFLRARRQPPAAARALAAQREKFFFEAHGRDWSGNSAPGTPDYVWEMTGELENYKEKREEEDEIEGTLAWGENYKNGM